MSAPEDAAGHLREAIIDASRGLVQRETIVELVVLCAVAKEHLLIIGPPGTAKSEAVRRIARRLGGEYFEYLVGRFTEPSEIFGPINLQKLKEGTVETETKGMLPEAEIAFLDEVFLGSTAILNTLLSILNERTFRRGHTRLSVPLRVCVGAANRLPEDEQLAAFADRFLARAFVRPIGDSSLEALLAAGAQLSRKFEPGTSSIRDIDILSEAALGMDLSAVHGTLAHAVRLLRNAGIELSDRRLVRAQRLIAAAAVLSGRSAPSSADLWPVVFALPTEADQDRGREVLTQILADSESSTLVAAPLEGSRGLRAHAARLLRESKPLIETASQVEMDESLMLRLEGLAREIDALFPKSTMPAEIAQLRAQVVARLGGPARAPTLPPDRSGPPS